MTPEAVEIVEMAPADMPAALYVKGVGLLVSLAVRVSIDYQ